MDQIDPNEHPNEHPNDEGIQEIPHPENLGILESPEPDLNNGPAVFHIHMRGNERRDILPLQPSSSSSVRANSSNDFFPSQNNRPPPLPLRLGPIGPRREVVDDEIARNASGDNPMTQIIGPRGISPVQLNQLQSVSSGYLADNESSNSPGSPGSNDSFQVSEGNSPGISEQSAPPIPEHREIPNEFPVRVRWINRGEDIEYEFEETEESNDNLPQETPKLDEKRSESCQNLIDRMQEILRCPSVEIFSRSGSETSVHQEQGINQSQGKLSRSQSNTNIQNSTESLHMNRAKPSESQPNLTINALTHVISNPGLGRFWQDLENHRGQQKGDSIQVSLDQLVSECSDEEKAKDNLGNNSQMKLVSSLIDLYMKKESKEGIQFDIWTLDSIVTDSNEPKLQGEVQPDGDSAARKNKSDKVKDEEEKAINEQSFVLSNSVSSTRMQFWNQFYDKIAQFTPIDSESDFPTKLVNSEWTRREFQSGDKFSTDQLKDYRPINHPQECPENMQKAKKCVTNMLRGMGRRDKSEERGVLRKDKHFIPTPERDFNNNRLFDEISSDETLKDITSKFRHSKDTSQKEEELRGRIRLDLAPGRRRSIEYIHTNSDRTSNFDKKSVRFDNNFPVYLKGRSNNRTSDTSVSLASEVPSMSSIGTIPSSIFGASSNCEEDEKHELNEYKAEVEDAEKEMVELFSEIKSLWVDINKEGGKPRHQSSLEVIKGKTRLVEMIKFSNLIVKEIKSEWRLLSLRSGSGTVPERLKELVESNRELSDELERGRARQGSLEDEVKYLEKEKQFIKQEVKQLSLKIAKYENGKEAASESLPELLNACTQTQPAPSQSKSSQINLPDNTRRIERSSSLISKSSETQFFEKVSSQMEEDFNSILTFASERGTSMASLHFKLGQSLEEIQSLKEEILHLSKEKAATLASYEALMEDYKKVYREREYYEGVLQLLLQDKQKSEFSIHELLETLVKKLGKMEESEGKSSKFDLLEQALRSAQEQNNEYKAEIADLKGKVEVAKEEKLKADELQVDYEEASKDLEELRRKLNEKEMEFSTVQKNLLDKITQMNEVHSLIHQAKGHLERSLADRENEIKRKEEELAALQVTKDSQLKKIQDLHKYNAKLGNQVKDYKKQVDQMSEVISQLNDTYNEAKTQWSDRVCSTGNDLKEAKEQCKILKSELDQLKIQLSESTEKISWLESERNKLRHQIHNFEEERKTFDRKLQEIKSAFKGDTSVKEALVEQNEELKLEINRLRMERIRCVSVNSETELRPSEVGHMDELNSIAGSSVVSSKRSNGAIKKGRKYSSGMTSPSIARTSSSDLSSRKNAYSSKSADSRMTGRNND